MNLTFRPLSVASVFPASAFSGARKKTDLSPMARKILQDKQKKIYTSVSLSQDVIDRLRKTSKETGISQEQLIDNALMRHAYTLKSVSTEGKQFARYATRLSQDLKTDLSYIANEHGMVMSAVLEDSILAELKSMEAQKMKSKK